MREISRNLFCLLCIKPIWPLYNALIRSACSSCLYTIRQKDVTRLFTFFSHIWTPKCICLYRNIKMCKSIVTYLLLYVLKKCWCQLTEDGEIITPQHVGPRTRVFIYFLWCCGPSRRMTTSFWGFTDHTQRHVTVGKGPLDERSDSSRTLYLTTNNTNKRKTSMLPAGFEPTISAS